MHQQSGKCMKKYINIYKKSKGGSSYRESGESVMFFRALLLNVLWKAWDDEYACGACFMMSEGLGDFFFFPLAQK